MQWDTIWINGVIIPCDESFSLLHLGAIAAKEGKIAWIGNTSDLPNKPEACAKEVIDLQGCTVTPGFIDCHTHLVYAGTRAQEFEQRLQGKSYTEIAQSGGGIQSTVAATRQASIEELVSQSLPRAQTLMVSGVTTIEMKSGYGLDWQTEKKLLQAISKIEEVLPVSIVKTFLGAHTLPKEYQSDPDKYIDMVCDEMIPQVASEQLADHIDVFCESIAFNLNQTEKVFHAAKEHGLSIKCHAEQLTHSGAAKLAANYGALSVDHLEYLPADEVHELTESGTVAVLLPGAYYFLRETQLPPVEALRKAGIPIAIASDCNPGTSPVTSILLILNMACTLFRLTPEEALLGITRHAAKALGLEDNLGSLAVGKMCDLAVWDIQHYSELAYNIGLNPLSMLVKQGEFVIQ